ncbi:hypothetical protein [Streptomyces sp. MZ04]|uniref:hypothetical protein n=1 Tax=Streptomyces sp. MZ04 TaxID=2559236 RepID=UPI00107ED15F|nr:hypothetical protein [Streptomyces sp. MZ04]TGB09781.1 hypothetical protein E2651_15640 [Streptomyces sp. MZ04]
MITFDHDTGKAQAAVDAARRRGLPVPQQIDDTAAMWQVVMDAAHMRPPERPGRDDVPATAEELRTLIEMRAHQHRIAEAHRQVAGDWHEPIARKYNALVAEHVTGWISALQPDFLALVKVLARQEKKLPELLDAQRIDLRDPAISAPWETASAAAVKLDQLVEARQILARAASQDLGRDAQLWAVAAVDEPTDAEVFAHRLRDEVGPAIRQWKELRHQPTARWLFLSRSPHFTLQLATPGEVAERQQVMDRWHQAVQVVMTSGLSRQQAQQAVATALRA